MAKKVVKKVTAPKPTKVAKPAASKKSTVEFVSFTFGATIPTQAFGNVEPHIEVRAASFEEARDFAVPKIEEFYRQYCDIKPGFLGKITETVKDIAPPTAAPTPAAPAKEAPEAPAAATAPAKPEAVLKAEKAISLVATLDAATMVQDQIEKSVKIPAEFKPELYTLVLKRRKELK